MFSLLKLRRGLIVGVAAWLLGGLAVAQDTVVSTSGSSGTPAVVVSTQQVREAFEKRFPGIGLSEVSTTQYPGLFEIRIGTDLLYVDGEVNYVLQGSLIDARTRTDVTAERRADLARVDFATLPLKDAIKQVKGDGSRVMAVFEDPNCGYCKMLHRNLKEIDNVTIYTFLFPILSPDSHERSRNIWCASDPALAWRSWMLEGTQPAAAECETPIESNLALGRKLMVTGTPAIIFADGSRVNGALPADALEQKLAQVAQKVARAR